MAREFAILADRTSPVATWLRALAATAHGECGGLGVGAIGMCFTGGFALAMAVEPAVLAPVLSQPALPAPITARKRAAVDLDDADLARVKRRAQDGMGVLGLRSPRTRAVPARFQKLRRELGERFEGIEIDSSPGNPYGIPARAHAVLAADLADEPEHATHAALDRVMTFSRSACSRATDHHARCAFGPRAVWIVRNGLTGLSGCSRGCAALCCDL